MSSGRVSQETFFLIGRSEVCVAGEKNSVYKFITIAGYLLLIPFVLVAGPLTGYVAGNYLYAYWKFPAYSSFLFTGLGLLGSVFESIRIIRAALQQEKRK